MDRYEARAEKPYRFVEIGKLGDEDRCRPSPHSKYRGLSGVLYGQIKAISPVHIGSGRIELTDNKSNPLRKMHTRCNGRTIIPGSSLKGCIRSIVEAISASCVPITGARYYQLPEGAATCGIRDKKERKDRELCVACRMFGSMGYLGKVRFSDAVLRDGLRTATASIPPLYSARDREDTYLDRDRKVKGRKFYMHGQSAIGGTPIEICPVGSVLDFTISFDNLTKAELGLLLVAMGQGEPKFHPKLGAAKPVCYGTVEISITNSKAFENMQDAYLQYDAEPVPVDLAECMEKAGDLILDEQLRQIAQILRPDSGRQCPSGNY